MNKDKIVETIGDMDPEFVKEARPKSRSRLALRIGAAAAAVLMLAGACFFVPKLIHNNLPQQEAQAPSVTDGPTAAPTAYPAPDIVGYLAAAPAEQSFVNYTDPASEEWVKALAERVEAGGDIAPMDGFMRELTLALMDGDDNVVWSPASVYMALAMLAECSDGNTREEILTALGADDMASLRKSAAALLAADNYDDGTVTSLIANSLWFNKEHYFNADTVGRLAELYRASTYWGDPTDPDYEKELQSWLKDNTGGLLDDSADKIEMDPAMLLEICSAVCFKGGWGERFRNIWGTSLEFHGTSGDTSVPGMYKQVHEGGRFWYGDGYKAAIDTIGTSGNNMIYLLPNEGVSIETMLKGINITWLLAHAKTGQLEITAPKFDVSSDNDLIPALREIGINDCFGPAADLTQLTDETAYVSEVRHSARVTVDENGISAAAFTQVELTLSMGEMSLTLDRPFVFIVTGVTGAPLFIGVVNNIA